MINSIPLIIAKCLIIENDQADARKVKDLLDELPYIKVMGVVSDVFRAMEIIRHNQPPDMLVLGTGSNNLNAFDIAVAVRDMVACMVFVGEDSQSAIKAFNVGADHFFAKPLRGSDFNFMISKLIIKKLQPGEITVNNRELRIPVQVTH